MGQLGKMIFGGKSYHGGETKKDLTDSSVAGRKKNSLELRAEKPLYTMSDLILPVYTKNKILDMVTYMENRQLIFEDWGLKYTHRYCARVSINLWGPSGTGKTMAAHAIADYLKRDILSVSYADIESKYVGETPKNIRSVFEYAKEHNSIIFFDEADAILSRRVSNMHNATDVSVNQTRSVLLMLLNDYRDIIIFATNFIKNFDPAFMRRILAHIRFDLPDKECRKKLWQMYIPEQMPCTADIDILAEKYAGVSGSDIAGAVLAGAFKAARHKKGQVDQSDLAEAIEDAVSSKKANGIIV